MPHPLDDAILDDPLRVRGGTARRPPRDDGFCTRAAQDILSWLLLDLW
jgi:hypothetical protein